MSNETINSRPDYLLARFAVDLALQNKYIRKVKYHFSPGSDSNLNDRAILFDTKSGDRMYLVYNSCDEDVSSIGS